MLHWHRPFPFPLLSGIYSLKVTFLRQFGAVLLLLVSCMTPAMACMASVSQAASQMTAEEQACCRMMKSQCGQMAIPGSTDCCKDVLPAGRDSVVTTDPVSFHHAVFAALWASSFDLMAPPAVAEGWLARPKHSPPKSPPSLVSALRV